MREKEPVIKIYELNKGNKFKETNKEHPLLDEITSTEFAFANHNLTGESLLTNYLHTNPFLYNPETTDVVVHSIEDFMIEVKREKMAFGDVLRNPKFKPKQRKKIIKRAFKKWRKDYLQKKNQTFKENDKVVEIIGELEFSESSLKTKLLIGLVFVLLMFLVITDSLVWNVLKEGSFGYVIYKSITLMYEKMMWLKIVGNLGIYLTLILIFHSSIYAFIIKDFKKNYKLAQAFLNNSEKTISREFNKKYKKARRYYLKRINNKKYPFFPPLNIEEVQEGKMNIKIFNEICKATIDRAYVVKKSKPYINSFKMLLQITGFVSAGIIVVMTLYNVILNIFS